MTGPAHVVDLPELDVVVESLEIDVAVEDLLVTVILSLPPAPTEPGPTDRTYPSTALYPSSTLYPTT